MTFRIATLLVFAPLLMAAERAAADEAPGSVSAYVLEGAEGLLQRFAPVFVIEHDDASFNKIGTAAARTTEGGKAEVYVDSSYPTIYTDVQPFETEKDRYTNLIYRIHFERNPFTLAPLNVSAGKNVGAIAVVTLNSREEPVWLTTHTPAEGPPS